MTSQANTTSSCTVKPLILRVPVVVPLIQVVPVIMIEHHRIVQKVTRPDKQVILVWYKVRSVWRKR
jgi:hypothetical protein